MKKILGYCIILTCGALLWLISEQLFAEWGTAQERAEMIEQSIELPDIETAMPVSLLDRNGKVFSEEYVEWRTPLALKEIPMIAQQMVLLSEDVGFYDHIGFDVGAIARAFVANNGGDKKQGGSTITQQLVRMRYLSQDKTYERKVLELFYAYELEQVLSKEQILNAYLNEMYYNNQVYGIGGAATYYFQQPLQELSTAQIAFLSAIPNNPSHYDPITNFTNTKARQELLLDVLVKHELLSAQQAEEYKAEEIVLNVKPKIQQQPAYSTYVLHEFTKLVAQAEGFDDRLKKVATDDERAIITKEIEDRAHHLMQSGLTIHTALDPDKQARDEQRINAILGGNLQAASASIDNENREIVSVYAGRDYEKYNFHRAYQAIRQPGSALKPLLVYAPLFEVTGYSPDSVVSGAKYCVGNYCPGNYNNINFGDVSIRTAFRYSINTTAVRMLNTVGLDTAFSYFDKFNFENITEEDHNYAAALGGVKYGVNVLQLADAYSSFVDGSYIPTHAIRKVTDAKGETLYQWKRDVDYIWSGRTVRYMHTLLADTVNNGTAKGVYSTNGFVGAKTGTAEKYNDLWLAGISNRYSGAVWLGYDEPASLQNLKDSKIHHAIFSIIIN